MLKKIKAADLMPGDIFLYHGTSLLSRMIRLFDGTEYSHASIYDGTQVVEALGNGIVTQSLNQSTAGAEYVHVYRYISTDTKEKLGSANFPALPVTARVAYYVANRQRYAYEQILLLAMLASTRRINIPGVSWLLRNVLDEAMSLVSSLLAAGKEPVICSELVYRCYGEAKADKYKIRIRGSDTIMSVAANSVSGGGGAQIFSTQEDPIEAAALQDDAAAFLNLYTMAKSHAVQADANGVPSFSVQAVPDFVTPGDLKKSPNLVLEGTLTV